MCQTHSCYFLEAVEFWLRRTLGRVHSHKLTPQMKWESVWW